MYFVLLYSALLLYMSQLINSTSWFSVSYRYVIPLFRIRLTTSLYAIRLRSMDHPLYQIEKVLQKGQDNVEDVDNLEAYLEVCSCVRRCVYCSLHCWQSSLTRASLNCSVDSKAEKRTQ